MSTRALFVCAAIAAAVMAAGASLGQTGKASGADSGGVHVRFALGSTSQAKPLEIVVTGKVTDAKTRKPIGNALVRGHAILGSFRSPDFFDRCPCGETRTDETGAYRLVLTTTQTLSAQPGSAPNGCVDAGAPGYETRPHYFSLRGLPRKTEFADVNIALGAGKHVTGKVVDEDEQPVPAALVRVDQGLNGDWGFFNSLGLTMTDAEGKFDVWCSTDSEITGGQPWLRIEKRGYGTGFYWGFLENPEMGALTLPKGGTIAGRVIDKQGKPMPGVTVTVRDSWPNIIDTVTTGTDGRFEIKGVPGDPTYKKFYEKKNGRYMDPWAQVTVYVLANPLAGLAGALKYDVIAKEGKTVRIPDMIAGAQASIYGKVIPSKTPIPLQGLLVRLDGSWDNMAEVDADGQFLFPAVGPGSHKLTVYMPTNLRYDTGIGRTEVTVPAGSSVGAKIGLDALAEVRVQILDKQGSPMEGIVASATWSRSGDGGWTEGTSSDQDGRAVVYLSAGDVQYIRGIDFDRKFVSEGFEKVKPTAGQVIDNVRITMVPVATIRGQLAGEDPESLQKKRPYATLKYADGNKLQRPLKLDGEGRFAIEGLAPGVVTIAIETYPEGLKGGLAEPVQLAAGQDKDLGTLTLTPLKYYKVSGKVVPSATFPEGQRFLIRLDLAEWKPMLRTDEHGGFTLPKVKPGKHRITAYLPFNKRTDRGVGHVEVEVKDADLTGVELPIETLATVHVQITDEAGRPLPHISAGATWTRSGDGIWTEGTKSDGDGKATLYLYPDEEQYVRGFDPKNKMLARSYQTVNLKAGQVVEDMRIVMLPAASIRAKLMDGDAALANKRVMCSLLYKDGPEYDRYLQTDSEGLVTMDRLEPGEAKLVMQTMPASHVGTIASLKIQAGQDKDLGEVALRPVTFHKVTGHLKASPTFTNLEGFKIRVDLWEWQPMVETDKQGRFVLDRVPDGRRRLTAYLPFNLRTDRGVGHVYIDVPDKDVEDAVLPLETLATVHMRIVDGAGKPLEGLPAAAFWTPDHSGVFTEGAKSDAKGQAVLYIYPDDKQYVGAIDWNRQWKMKQDTEMTLKAGEVVKDLTVVMVPEDSGEQEE
jgi:protocatechuate 3,4-dioxygenase beta subunit